MRVDHSLPRVFDRDRDCGGPHQTRMVTTVEPRLWPSPRLIPAAAMLVLLAGGGTTPARADAAQAAPPPQPSVPVEQALVLDVEGFCSETRLRTSNARITWRAGASALGPGGLPGLAAATQRLETTVFKNGFAQGLFVALPIGTAAVDRPIAAIAQAPATQQPPRRAYQIRLITVNAARASAASDGASEMDAVVENLEPGVNYTWRIAIDGPTGRVVSPSISQKAPVCPADMADTPPTPAAPRKRP